MRRKILVGGLALLIYSGSANAFVPCSYQDQPCDEQGDHFFCTGRNMAFCSATNGDYVGKQMVDDQNVNVETNCCYGTCWSTGCCPPTPRCTQDEFQE